MSDNVLEFTDTNFESEVLNSELPVLVDFWATWCGPCKAIGPIVEELAKEYTTKIKVGKVNVDDNNQVAMQFGVRSIPTLIIVKEGKVIDQIIGAVPKESIVDLISKVL